MNTSLLRSPSPQSSARPSVALPLALLASVLASPAFAQSAPAPAAEESAKPQMPSTAPVSPVADDKPYVVPRSLSEWASNIKLGLQGQGGIVINPHSPDNQTNFGQLTTDKANRPVLNQILMTVSRDVDPKATSVDIGFKLQAMYGSDSRIFHTLGMFDQLIHDRNQLAMIEANVTARIPQLFAGGMDVKAGLYPTPLGLEVMDAKANPFYSHSYIFNFGLPLKHLGVLTTSHVSDMVDVYFGVDSGTNTGPFYGAGDNNNRPGGIAGVGLNLLGGKLTVLALTHIGPENSKRAVPFANDELRYFNDIAITYKATDKLTLSGELNYVRDDGFDAEAFGGAAYVSYAMSDTVTLNGRAEIFRDANNFFVANPVKERDFANFQRGSFARMITASKPTTYSAFTVGATYKPSFMPAWLSTAMIRPEVRYDQTLNNSSPFGNGNKRSVLTVATDLVLGF